MLWDTVYYPMPKREDFEPEEKPKPKPEPSKKVRVGPPTMEDRYIFRFSEILRDISYGHTIEETLHRQVSETADPVRFMRWLAQYPRAMSMYHDAKRIHAELTMERMEKLALGVQENDLALKKAKLAIDTMKFRIQSHYKERYQPTRMNISLSASPGYIAQTERAEDNQGPSANKALDRAKTIISQIKDAKNHS